MTDLIHTQASSDERRPPRVDPLAFLAGGGEMGERTRAFDWSRTALGPAELWPPSLKTAVSMMLGCQYPLLIWWGADLLHFYNDAYLPVLGRRHPSALGCAAQTVWPEAWPTLGPQADAVMNDRPSQWNEELLMTMTRNGYAEEVYMSFSYGPILDDDGHVGGVFCACTEDTQRVLGRRRLDTLRALAIDAGRGTSAEEACEMAASTLLDNPHDVPFALIYLLDPTGERALLAGVHGLLRGASASPSAFELTAADAPWPFAEVASTGRADRIVLNEGLPGLPGGPWPEPAIEAVVLPVASPGQGGVTGFVVAGCSPRRPIDGSYLDFLELVAGQIATSVANARAFAKERHRAEALAEVHRAKTTFFSNASRELRTPLTFILGPVEALLAGPAAQGDHEVRLRLETVHRNALRLLEWADTLLDTSSSEATEGAPFGAMVEGPDADPAKPLSARELPPRVEAHVRMERQRPDAGETIRRSDERLRRMIDIEMVGVLIFERCGRLLSANDAFLRQCGADRESLAAGRLWWREVAAPDDPEVTKQQLRQLEETRRIGPYEKEYARPDGSHCCVVFAGADLGDGAVVEYCIDITDRKRAERELRRLNETLEQRVEQRARQVRALAAHAARVEQEERRRIAHILHDDLQQLLYGITLKLGLVRSRREPQSAAMVTEQLAEVESWVRRATQLTRALSVELSPPILQKGGLSDALEWLARQMFDLHGFEVQVDVESPLASPEPEVGGLLFQSARELLFNAKKHSGAPRAHLQLRQEREQLIMHVADEGRGFELERASQDEQGPVSFGLASIRERVTLIGGRLEVRSRPGHGTRIELRVPLQFGAAE